MASPSPVGDVMSVAITENNRFGLGGEMSRGDGEEPGNGAGYPARFGNELDVFEEETSVDVATDWTPMTGTFHRFELSN